MALAKGLSEWQDSGTTQSSTDAYGNPCLIPVYNPVYSGDWHYTDANSNVSVCCDLTKTQAEAEANRDLWLAAGGIA